jgi:hypothetical protein
MRQEVAAFYRGTHDLIISKTTIMSDKHQDIEYLHRCFGSRVWKAREKTTLEERCEVLAEDFNGYRLDYLET